MSIAPLWSASIVSFSSPSDDLFNFFEITNLDFWSAADFIDINRFVVDLLKVGFDIVHDHDHENGRDPDDDQ